MMLLLLLRAMRVAGGLVKGEEGWRTAVVCVCEVLCCEVSQDCRLGEENNRRLGRKPNDAEEGQV